MVGIGEAYLPAFVLALSLGEVASGLITTVPLVAGAVLQLVSPRAVARLRSHRRWVVLCASVQALSFVPLVFGALWGSLPVGVVFLVAALYWGTGLATGPAWNSWVGRTVPGRLRARFFSRRSRFNQAAVLSGFLAGGIVLQLGAGPARAPLFFAVLFSVALLARVSSSWFLYRQSEPALTPEQLQPVTPGELLRRLRRGNYGRVLLYLLLVQMAVQISGPYFTPYMLRQLSFSYAGYAAILSTTYLTKVVALPLFGRIARVHGARWLLWAGGCGIVPVSGLWAVSEDFYFLLAVQVLSGIAWAAYELGSFLLIFDIVPFQERTSVLTLHNLANSIAMAGGSFLGALILWRLGENPTGYKAVFLGSSAARLLALPFYLQLSTLAVKFLPLVFRVVALRPGSGSIDRPLHGVPAQGDGAEGKER
jgi:MFS family permease